MPRRLVLWGVLVMLLLPARAEDAKDPHLWLEDVTGEKALAWVKERNAESTAELTKDRGLRQARTSAC